MMCSSSLPIREEERSRKYGALCHGMNRPLNGRSGRAQCSFVPLFAKEPTVLPVFRTVKEDVGGPAPLRNRFTGPGERALVFTFNKVPMRMAWYAVSARPKAALTHEVPRHLPLGGTGVSILQRWWPHGPRGIFIA